jgi:hypothetical protein
MAKKKPTRRPSRPSASPKSEAVEFSVDTRLFRELGELVVQALVAAEQQLAAYFGRRVAIRLVVGSGTGCRHQCFPCQLLVHPIVPRFARMP